MVDRVQLPTMCEVLNTIPIIEEKKRKENLKIILFRLSLSFFPEALKGYFCVCVYVQCMYVFRCESTHVT